MVQDPNFWRRFSVAVHNDEAAILAKDAESGAKGKRETKHADSWLEGQQRKARQRAYMCWAFWGVFLVVVVGAIVAVLVLKGKGII